MFAFGQDGVDIPVCCFSPRPVVLLEIGEVFRELSEDFATELLVVRQVELRSVFTLQFLSAKWIWFWKYPSFCFWSWLLCLLQVPKVLLIQAFWEWSVALLTIQTSSFG